MLVPTVCAFLQRVPQFDDWLWLDLGSTAIDASLGLLSLTDWNQGGLGGRSDRATAAIEEIAVLSFDVQGRTIGVWARWGLLG